MIPAKLKEPDITFTAPEGMENCADLEVKVFQYDNGEHVAISAWKPSKEELEVLNNGGYVTIHCPAFPPPPIGVGADMMLGLVELAN